MPRDEFGDQFDLKKIPIPSAPRGLLRWGIPGLILLLLIISSVYTVGPEEIGVVLRLGKFQRSTEPGLHFKFPFGIERVTKVPIQRQLKEEFGFQTVSAGVRSQYTTRGREAESLMLTGDLNAAVVEWVVQYRIVDAYKYLFRVRNVRITFRDMSEAVVREVVGDRTVNEVLTIGRQEVADLVSQVLQDLCDQYETGIKVEQVVLQDVNPPDPVKPSFNDVNEAQQEKERLINQAQAEYNKVIPRARGEAEQTIRQAEGYALDRLNRARGDSARFVAFFEEYRKAPEITRKRIYLETLNEILPRVSAKIIVDDDLNSVLPLLNLETWRREPRSEKK
ncbi:MAG: FtsH protease activity modulator HflK [Candidatus Latescibacteria bacterium]|nr:FtsH protease activity modulator HflK [Candidatus Latescibacterota bacterium]NIO28344.1 FtsH protease activity modulator HflK [Candidatus Latescibacterota bacterium]NIO55891.1 FtsH protease activity modulator HflK [Candidatus Latescibacterota bacterium]NIT01857.1 FtsH protease activity modulator HflK [Candidatus Latescibacterota bacterium]